MCESGRLYEHLGGITGLTREETKTELIKQAFFSRNGYSNATKRAFRGEFPEVAEYIRRIKEKDHTQLAIKLQHAEAHFVIRTVCERIRKERPEMFVGTVHDCLMVIPEDAEYAQSVMVEEFATLGLKLSVEVKMLFPSNSTGSDDWIAPNTSPDAPSCPRLRDRSLDGRSADRAISAPRTSVALWRVIMPSGVQGVKLLRGSEIVATRGNAVVNAVGMGVVHSFGSAEGEIVGGNGLGGDCGSLLGLMFSSSGSSAVWISSR